jgi:hypothetical protein
MVEFGAVPLTQGHRQGRDRAASALPALLCLCVTHLSERTKDYAGGSFYF